MLTKKQLLNIINGIEWEDIEIKKAKSAIPSSHQAGTKSTKY
jgi:hypothetical protein